MGLSESTLVKMPHCWKSHVTAHIIFLTLEISFISANTIMQLMLCCIIQ